MTSCTAVNKERKLAIQRQLETWKKKHEKNAVKESAMRGFAPHSGKIVNMTIKDPV